MTIFSRTAVAIALGFSLLGGAAFAAPAGLAGSAPLGAASTTTVAPVEQVNHRRNHRRHYRGGGGSFSLYIGPGRGYYGPRYYGPRYHAPRYHGPRYHRPARASAHYRWCNAKYRSYRARDNTFQPYHGSRRQCVSPYF